MYKYNVMLDKQTHASRAPCCWPFVLCLRTSLSLVTVKTICQGSRARVIYHCRGDAPLHAASGVYDHVWRNLAEPPYKEYIGRRGPAHARISVNFTFMHLKGGYALINRQSMQIWHSYWKPALNSRHWKPALTWSHSKPSWYSRNSNPALIICKLKRKTAAC